jgi:hypothetical protein
MVQFAPVESTAAFTVSNTGTPAPFAALAGGDARDHLGAVSDHLLCMKQALAARDALHDEAGVFVDEDAHGN